MIFQKNINSKKKNADESEQTENKAAKERSQNIQIFAEENMKNTFKMKYLTREKSIQNYEDNIIF